MDEFLRKTKEIKEYGDFAVWRNQYARPWPVDNNVFSTEHVIRSWQIPETTGRFLYRLVQETGAKNILELGTSIGYSTIWLAEACRQEGGKVITIEQFRRKANQAKRHFEKMGLENITLIEKPIVEALQKLGTENFDLVFMDADKGQYHIYIEYILPMLNEQGIIVVDNAGNFRQRMRQFIEKCESTPGIVMHLFDFDNGLLVIAKSENPIFEKVKNMPQY